MGGVPVPDCPACDPSPIGGDEPQRSARALLQHWHALTPIDREILVTLAARWAVVETPPGHAVKHLAATAGKVAGFALLCIG
jgi:hypothetical protein